MKDNKAKGLARRISQNTENPVKRRKDMRELISLVGEKKAFDLIFFEEKLEQNINSAMSIGY
jgi:hypothetical protein